MTSYRKYSQFVVLILFSVTSIQDLQGQSIFIQTDRAYYFAKDTLWFCTYIFDSKTLKSADNQIVYVKLIDTLSRVIAQKTGLTDKGKFDNFFPLSDSLSGKFQLVAYTKNLLKNDFVFRKEIFIKNQPLNQGKEVLSITNIDLQFLPEGGHLVSGLPAIVAFRCTDKFGEGIDFGGVIVDENNEEIITINSEHTGKGVFAFTPQATKTYRAVVDYQNQRHTFSLPKVQEKGIVIRISHAEKDSLITVRLYQNYAETDEITLKINCRGAEIFSKQLKIINGTTLKIHRNDIPKGIVQFCVFKNNQLMVERLACVNRFGGIEFSLEKKADTTNKIVLDIVAKGMNPSQEVSLSVSVTDCKQNLNDTFGGINLNSFLFLQADLRGTIHNSMYYFDASEPNSYKHLDLVLLTHGWTKYRWNDTLFDEVIETKPKVRGQINANSSKRNLKNVKVIYKYLGIINKVETDENGIFEINDLDLKEGNPLYIQAGTDDEFTIKILNPEDSVKYKFDIKHSQSENVILNSLKNTSEQIITEKEFELDGVVVKAKRIDPEKNSIINNLASNLSTGINIVTQSRRDIFNDLPLNYTLIEFLNLKIPEIRLQRLVEKNDANFIENTEVLAVSGNKSTTSLRKVRVFRNDVELAWPGNQLANLSLKDIGIVSYFKAAAEANPVIILVSKDLIPNYDYSKDIAIGNIVLNDIGVSQKKEFYVPVYDSKQNLEKSENRTTLYWNANILTNLAGKAKVMFQKPINANCFCINIEGTDWFGNVGSFRKVINDF